MSKSVKTKEPPCTERYARWCERSVTQLMGDLLLDYTVASYPHQGIRFWMGIRKNIAIDKSTRYVINMMMCKRKNDTKAVKGVVLWNIWI